MNRGQYTGRKLYECYLTLRRLLIKDWFIGKMVTCALRHTQTMAMHGIEEIGRLLHVITLMLEATLSHGTVRNRMLSLDPVLNPSIDL